VVGVQPGAPFEPVDAVSATVCAAFSSRAIGAQREYYCPGATSSKNNNGVL